MAGLTVSVTAGCRAPEEGGALLALPALGVGGGSLASSENQSCFKLLRVTLSVSERCADRQADV